jgi:hypothetical protein
LIGDPPWLGADDNLRVELPDRLVVGTGQHQEQGLDAAVFALHPTMNLEGGPNEGFRRPGAALAVVFVSTRDDEGSEAPQEVLGELAAFAGGVDLLQVSAAAGGDSFCRQFEPAVRYAAVASFGSAVCSVGDESEVGFPDLSRFYAELITSFRLTDAAVPDTLEVVVDDQRVESDPSSGWTYDPATWEVTFHGDSVPPRGSRFEISYDVDFDG